MGEGAAGAGRPDLHRGNVTTVLDRVRAVAPHVGVWDAAWLREVSSRVLTREVRTFLAVGCAGYLVDIAAFNLLLSMRPFATRDPAVARTIAVAAAMCVTYVGSRTLTWRDHTSGDRRREVGLFVLFNIIGFGFSLVTLTLSHDILGLTSRLADNLSANVVGVALGTIFRFLTYRRFVFAAQVPTTSTASSVGVGLIGAPQNTPASGFLPSSASHRSAARVSASCTRSSTSWKSPLHR